MVTTELGACEWFVWDLRRSNLLDRGQLDQIIGDFLTKHPRAEPPELATYLINETFLTQFQAERLLQGKTQGFVLGPFTLMDALGSGSMGTVYKAQSKNDNLWYAVKVLPRRSMWNVRIARRKVRAFEQTQHPSVVPFVDVGTSGGMHYLAWPFVEGETLDKLIAKEGKMHHGKAACLAVQIAEGLDICHQQGLFHGLLKPSNLLLAAADPQVKILDFGIGCLLAETEGESLVDTMSTANSVTSGLDCASPESIMDPTNLTPAGDQYSLGCVLYYMLTGQFPFPDGSAAEKMMAHQLKEPTPIRDLSPDVPKELTAIVERLMKKSPSERFANTTEVVADLRPFAKTPELAKAESRLLSRRDCSSKLSGSKNVPSAAPEGLLTLASAKGGGEHKASLGVSSPTPKPQALGSLPNRDSLNPPAKKAGTGAPTDAPEIFEEPAERVVPGAIANDPLSRILLDRLGPVGITIAALLASSFIYFAAAYFRLF